MFLRKTPGPRQVAKIALGTGVYASSSLACSVQVAIKHNGQYHNQLRVNEMRLTIVRPVSTISDRLAYTRGLSSTS
jgi:hypothetical protein